MFFILKTDPATASLTASRYWRLSSIFDLLTLILQAGYSNSTEELNNEMKNLESVMKDLNAIATPSQSQYKGPGPAQTQC